MPHGQFPTWEEWSLDVLAILDAVGAPSVALFAEGEAGECERRGGDIAGLAVHIAARVGAW